MKKNIILALSLSMILLLNAGCCGAAGGKSNKNESGEALKTGLAVISSIAKSIDAGEKDGVAQVDSTVIAVTVDNDGRIVKCKIDAAQTVINFSNTGKITTPLDKVFKTKQELGTEYGMNKASTIKKDWNEQANALAEYVTGKTIAEIKGIAVNEKGAPAGKELSSSVTMSIGGYIDAIEKAVANAK